MKIETFAIAVIVGLALYRILLWLMEAARTADPWGPEVKEALDKPDALPLCPHCLAPQDHNGWFCPECGSTVGRYSNYLPNVYIFSIGEAFRRGISERVRPRSLIVIGYALVSLCFLSVLAPIAWIFLFKRLAHPEEQEPSTAPA